MNGSTFFGYVLGSLIGVLFITLKKRIVRYKKNKKVKTSRKKKEDIKIDNPYIFGITPKWKRNKKISKNNNNS